MTEYHLDDATELMLMRIAQRHGITHQEAAVMAIRELEMKIAVENGEQLKETNPQLWEELNNAGETVSRPRRRSGPEEYEDMVPVSPEEARLVLDRVLDELSPTGTATPPSPPDEGPHHGPAGPPQPGASA